LRDSLSPYRPVALVDDAVRKVGKEIHGLRVAGMCEEIPALVARYQVDMILIALPTASARRMRRLIEICESTGLPFRILPRSSPAMRSGRISAHDLRDVGIEDLLGRPAIRMDWQGIAESVKGKSILVSGAGGSIGKELCRQLAPLEIGRLVVFERCEFNLYAIERELRETFPQLPLVPVLGDVCDAVTVEAVMKVYAPQVVFHAAAYKHVPILEGHIRAGVQNNVFGTRNVATLADRYGCETFVLISSDKAVNPANTMGATKRVAEMVCQDLDRRSKTSYITVRFGNVLGSSGSVIPLFQEQIARGGPVTVTHPDVERYFMTISEACQLILQASAIGKGGEVFVLDMGEPIKISYLAEQMVRLAGKRPGEDIEIVYTGLRPGEKLYEELFHDAEQLTGTCHPKIMHANCRQFDTGTLERGILAMKEACESFDEKTLRMLLTSLVPESASIKNEVISENRPSATVIPLVNLMNRDAREA
jgi:FlaA1/EpsC-like NDP-sugar epimerase